MWVMTRLKSVPLWRYDEDNQELEEVALPVEDSLTRQQGDDQSDESESFDEQALAESSRKIN